MNKSTHNELWQVEVGGNIYEAAFSELGLWIGDGSLLPDDKIRKGNLRWTQAKLVPTLIPFFNAKAAGVSMPAVQTTTSVAPTIAPSEVTQSENNVTAAVAQSTEVIRQVAEHKSIKVNDKICLFHPDLSSLFQCAGCGSGFCKTCPKSYGGTVKICPHCGQMCKPVGEAKAQQQQTGAISSSKGFGAGDFFSALGYPFKFKVSLFIGAVMFMLLTLGRGAAGMGGIFMIVGGVFSGMWANALTFAVLSNTIDNFIQGKFDENFMPEFDDFELWGDVVHPFFLSIAAYLSSFGPFLLVLAIGFYLVTSAVGDQMDAYKSDLERIPGTQVYAGRGLADQSGDVKDVLKDIDRKQRERIAAGESVDEGQVTSLVTQPTPVVDEESRQQEELWAAVNESRKKSLESAIGKMPETQEQEDAAMIKAFLGLAAPLVVIGFITFVWGLIFFPASCAVAGYSRSFVATINPLIGLDTIKRLGVDYVKILAMGFVLLLSSLVVGGILGAIFAVFDMPLVGNLPATALGAIFSFYLMAVFSCILGYALFKSADKLGLAR